MRNVIIFVLELYQSIVWSIGKQPYEIKKMSNPNQSYKHRVIKYYAKKYKCKTFIETGIYLGGTVQAVKDHFKDVHSIEVAKKLYEDNCRRFRNDKKVHLYCGDSMLMLGKMIDKARGKNRILFFLDGHYSGGVTGMGTTETPVEYEIETIFSKLKGRHFVVLIDDARAFTGEHDYPVLGDFMKELQAKGGDRADVSVKSDIIRVIV